MLVLVSFIVSVMAGIVTHYIFKWLDSHFNSEQ